jgi:hypothetical protein
MSEPSGLVKPEEVAAGGGVLGALLFLVKWVFTTRVSEVKTEVKEVRDTLSVLTKTLTDIDKKLDLVTHTQVTRAEFDTLAKTVIELRLKVEHIEEQVRQGVVPR